MKIKEKLEALRNYYAINRKVGHTKLIEDGTKNSDKKLILVHKKTDILFSESKEDQVSWNSLDRLIGEDKPLVIDNAVMLLLLDEAINKIERLEEDAEKLRTIKNIVNGHI
jgi:hypothetical protein